MNTSQFETLEVTNAAHNVAFLFKLEPSLQQLTVYLDKVNALCHFALKKQ